MSFELGVTCEQKLESKSFSQSPSKNLKYHMNMDSQIKLNCIDKYKPFISIQLIND